MLDKLDIFEGRVRERAFRLWQEAGCPENSADEFWHRAREIEMKENNLSEKDIDRAGEDSFPASDPTNFASF